MVWVGIGLYAAVAAGAPTRHRADDARNGVVGGFAAVSLGMIAVFSADGGSSCSFIPAVGACTAASGLPFLKVIGHIAPFGAGLALATLGVRRHRRVRRARLRAPGLDRRWLRAGGFGTSHMLRPVSAFGGWPDRFGGARVATWSLLDRMRLVSSCCGWRRIRRIAFAGAILTGIGFALVFPSFGIEAVEAGAAGEPRRRARRLRCVLRLGFGLAGPTTGLMAGAFGYPSVFAIGALGAAAAVLVARRSC